MVRQRTPESLVSLLPGGRGERSPNDGSCSLIYCYPVERLAKKECNLSPWCRFSRPCKNLLPFQQKCRKRPALTIEYVFSLLGRHLLLQAAYSTGLPMLFYFMICSFHEYQRRWSSWSIHTLKWLVILFNWVTSVVYLNCRHTGAECGLLVAHSWWKILNSLSVASLGLQERGFLKFLVMHQSIWGGGVCSGDVWY